MKKAMTALLTVIGLLILAGPVLAHSTAGRVKVPLDFKQPEVDDVAYFIESYVHRELYSDGTAGTENRFVVKDFIKVEQDKDTAVVRFVTLDKKDNNSFEDSMALQRGSGGVWLYQPKNGGEPLELHTYITTARYNWETRWKRLAILFGTLFCLSPLALWHVRRSERKAMAAHKAHAERQTKAEETESLSTPRA